MASSNQSPEYQSAERNFLLARTDEEKLFFLEEMIRHAPKHKSGEAMRANLKTRLAKLKEKLESKKKQKKSGSKEGIKKEEMQAVLIGLTNSGKSSVIECLTNARPKIAPFPYTTRTPLIGTLNYEGVLIQLIDMPAIDSEYFNQGIANTSDTLLIIIENTRQIEEIFPFLEKSLGKRIIVLNKIDLLSEEEKIKAKAFLQSKKYNFVLFSCKTKENLNELKEKLWESFDKIRIYTKQPGKPADSTPVILGKNSSVEILAEKIFHGFSSKIKETRITGPSGKFPNQQVSLSHVLKDRDIVEFKVRD